MKCRSNSCTARSGLHFFHDSSWPLYRTFQQESSRCVETGAPRSDLPMTTDHIWCITRFLWWVPGQQYNYHIQSFPVTVQVITGRHMEVKSKTVVIVTTSKFFFRFTTKGIILATLSQQDIQGNLFYTNINIFAVLNSWRGRSNRSITI